MNLNINNSRGNIGYNMLMIDVGDISKMIGYTLKIIDYVGKVAYETLINQQVFDLDLSAIGGRGIYFLEVIDDSSRILEIKKIVLR